MTKRRNAASAMGGVGRTHNHRVQFDYRPIADLKLPERSLRVIGKRVEKRIERCLLDFGPITPAVIDGAGSVYVGAELVAAAKRAGLSEYPVALVSHLDDEQLRLFRMAHARLTDGCEWDYETLRIEFSEISMARPDLDLNQSGWEVPQRDYIYGLHRANELVDDDATPVTNLIEPVSRVGDVWMLGRHILVCGDSLDPEVITLAVNGEPVRAVITDPPYNVRIANNVSGKGKVKHEEFAQASGELTEAEFTSFLSGSIEATQPHLVDGALLYIFQDWRHIMELCGATRARNLVQLNLLVWAKTKASQGSFYRSAHELVGLFKHGKGRHTNNVELGRHGRSRSNVITMPGPNGFGKGRQKALETHPTCKPVGLVADLILDCSAPGERILDPFGGSGTTLIAAEKVDRVASLVELEPKFVDATIRRFEALTGEKAIHRDSEMAFEAMASARAGENA